MISGSWGVQVLARISKKSKSGSHMIRRSWKPIVRGSCTVNVTTRSLGYGLPTPSKHTQARKPAKFKIDRLRQVGQKNRRNIKNPIFEFLGLDCVESSGLSFGASLESIRGLSEELDRFS